jgi:NAD(P)-dependent dehydrogenase (short-subunit alcohol dehydrogenase family)
MAKTRPFLINRKTKLAQTVVGRNAAFLGGAALGALTLWKLRKRTRMSFKGRSVLITGGSRGLGLVLARELAAEGARLILLARDPTELARAEMDLAKRGADVLTIPCDIRNQHEVERTIQRVIEHYGRIDVLINNAGVVQVGPVEHMQLKDFEEALAVHAWGPLYTMLAAIPHMRRQGGGRIVNISSIGGLVAVPHLLPYSMSKFALVGLSDGMRAELAKDGIRVTTVCPGLMRTGSHMNAFVKGQHQREFAWFAILSGFPAASTDVRRAARQIIEASRRGDAQLIITPQARLMALAEAFFPNLTAHGMAFMNRLLPGPTQEEGDERRTGWESQSRWAPSLLTRLADRAVSKTNSLRGHSPVVSE